MNEPASWGVGDTIQGCANNNINNPPYTPATLMGGNLQEQTICPDANQVFGRHYDTHSLYGWSESEPTMAGVRQALGTRGVTLTRSSFLGNGQWASHWLGDNYSKWTNLHYSIIGMLSFNHFGVPYVGADICGFGEVATPEMCLRWQQLGAFYTFSRNHNAIGNPDQDPGNFGPDFAASARKALLVRYTLLPYLYTLFHIHVTKGETVIRALWHEFPRDQTALGIDKQFLWGSGLLVSAVLDQGATSVNAYFPDARWYDYYTGSEVAARGQWLELDAPLDFINVHVRGGIVYPTQVPAINTELSRNNPFGLIVALDDAGAATGKIFVDDGDSIDTQGSGLYFEADYVVTAGVLTGSVKNEGFDVSTKVLDTVRLLGAGTVREVKLNGVVHPHFTNEPSGEVKITQLNASLNSATFRLEWTN
jgi:alpha-glucosidase (family GH31 glycosyl hydrolase)